MVLAAAAFAAPALAYEYPLSSTAIREAYFAGTSTDWTYREFLGEYTHTLRELRDSGYISSVGIETPYAHRGPAQKGEPAEIG